MEVIDGKNVVLTESKESFTFGRHSSSEQAFSMSAKNEEIFEEVVNKSWDMICKGIKSKRME